ncbi:glycosyltransferase [Frigidibacter sp. ROC022]|uniref:glycosyltransferase n=1 Tax=Frigidibacter sp. ROC022 TaxID=2971796 RepID=UPI00215AA405|nr:glycosyltransferase [Frigidibacter sp. ROC022]MCR8726830.1 glycosyltransferase [Frigidibacter sp. ROC022]
MRIELVISTYNAPRSLRLTLLSVPGQRRRPDSICIADDGSGPETAAVIRDFAAAHPDLAPRHVWHPDRGFEKNAILNKAVASSQADLMIFTDGDCLMHPGFVARHAELADPRRYACGSLIRLNAAATAAVTEEDVTSGRVFDRGWLRAQGAFDRLTSWLKSGALPRPLATLLERSSPVRRTWSGSNASAFRSAIVAVNGFDEAMKYGGEDKEFGVRLANSGVRGRHLRFSAPLVHLDHARSYVDAAKLRENRARIIEARRSGRSWTPNGLVRK